MVLFYHQYIYTSIVYYYNLNVSTMQYVTLEDVLGKNYIELANTQINQQIKTRQENGSEVFFTQEEGGFETISEEQNFYINNAGNVVIVFEKYEIAPGSMGNVEPTYRGKIFNMPDTPGGVRLVWEGEVDAYRQFIINGLVHLEIIQYNIFAYIIIEVSSKEAIFVGGADDRRSLAMWEELGISGGTALIVLIALYFIVKWAVRNAIQECKDDIGKAVYKGMKKYHEEAGSGIENSKEPHQEVR